MREEDQKAGTKETYLISTPMGLNFVLAVMRINQK
jgi:hypothetical protein